ncbi:MAG: hypothetical protein J7L07_00500 [Candidatus Odinarchaeota archaeon]|nr:hypothetical protein [Candidatus Odinarchaeota archaeon]
MTIIKKNTTNEPILRRVCARLKDVQDPFEFGIELGLLLSLRLLSESKDMKDLKQKILYYIARLHEEKVEAVFDILGRI